MTGIQTVQTADDMSVSELCLDKISVGTRKRSLDVAKVNGLAGSIAQVGLMNPITVTSDYRLIAGCHRLEAFKALGRETILAIILDVDELAAELAEIDENLMRNELNVLERGEHQVRRKEIYEMLHPETKRGGNRGNQYTGGWQSEMISFSQDAAQKTNKSKRTIEQEIQIATKLDETVKTAIRGTELADSKTDLLKLSRLGEDEQNRVVKRVMSGQSNDVRSAVESINRESRLNQLESLAKQTPPINQAFDIRFPVLYADPPWRYEHCSTANRAIENHYPTLELDEICNLPVDEICTRDAILFLWVPVSKVTEEAGAVIKAWGFRQVSGFVWDKLTIGPGYWVRQRAELLLIATRGDMPTPEPSNRPDSVIAVGRGAHSEKPERFYELIEQMCPGLPKLELFARGKREGWHRWGAEVQP